MVFLRTTVPSGNVPVSSATWFDSGYVRVSSRGCVIVPTLGQTPRRLWRVSQLQFVDKVCTGGPIFLTLFPVFSGRFSIFFRKEGRKKERERRKEMYTDSKKDSKTTSRQPFDHPKCQDPCVRKSPHWRPVDHRGMHKMAPEKPKRAVWVVHGLKTRQQFNEKTPESKKIE